MPDPVELSQCTGFQWDEGNAGKNWDLHRVSDSESEQVFFNQPRIMRRDLQHSQNEPRYYLLGRTNAGRTLFVSFAVRGDLIRVISAREMNRKEGRRYERA
jgi:uncharacterized DUF497 family protein